MLDRRSHVANEESVDAGTAEALLRRFEPVIRFTKGEWFYPMDCEPYVDACSLWVSRPGEDAVCVVPYGELTLERLAQQPEDTTGAVHYLKIPNPKEDGDRGRRTRRRAKRSHTNPDWPKETFQAGRGRLARVGYLSRLADALFSLALLARGRVPGGDVEGGRVLYGRFMEKGQRFTYHGNVVRQDGWIVLRYWLFYAFNDWRSNVFGANDHEADWEKPYEQFTIPFVDDGRGDGLSVGPGQDMEWDPPRLMNPVPSWVSGYRGLWGLYTRDPFEGEDAPAGPMYNRDKTISREWFDPVGWAGLDKVPTRAEELEVITGRQAEIEERRDLLRSELREKNDRLKELGMEAEATRDRSHLSKLHERQTRDIEELSGEVETLRERLSDDEVLAESLKDHAERLKDGERPPARAHIVHAARPVSEAETHAGRVAQMWASISIALVLVTLILIIAYERSHLLSALVFAIAVFAFIEAGFRRRLTRFIVSVNVALAVVGALVILEHYFWSVIVLAVLGIGFYILWENLRELGR